MGIEFKGKNVLIVDDSIVRGTTSHEIVQMARDAGAAKVIFASAAPPVKFPNVYGIDMPTPEELIAFSQGRLARYKSPREVRIVPSLPKSPIGKILRKDLRREAHTPS